MSAEAGENGAAGCGRRSGTTSKKCEFLRENIIGQGKWLSLAEVTYSDPHGKQRTWEAVKRTTKQEGQVDGVVVMAVMRRVLHHDCAIFVKQYRPPLKAYTLEWPAGLVDAGETAEAAAIRELREETGYTAVIKHCSPATCLDSGTEDCTVRIATADIDGDEDVNKNPTPNTDDGEFIEVVHIPTSQLLENLNELSREGVVVDTRIYTYAIALVQATKPEQLEPAQK